MICFSKLHVAKKFMEETGVSRVSFVDFLSHSGEKFRRGTLLWCVSEIFR